MELPEGVSFKDKNIIVVSPGRTNEDIIHLFITLGLLKKAGARQIVIVEPYMGYSRQHTFFVDKKAYGANSTKIIFDIFNGLRGDGFEIVAAIGDTIHYAREGVAKTERTYDAEGDNRYISPIDIVSLNSLPEIAKDIVMRIKKVDKKAKILFMADEGSIEVAKEVLAGLGIEGIQLAEIRKDRIGETEVLFYPDEIYLIEGDRRTRLDDLSDYTVVILDDELRTGTTLEELVKLLLGEPESGFPREKAASDVYIGVVHAVVSYRDRAEEEIPMVWRLVRDGKFICSESIMSEANREMEKVGLSHFTAREVRRYFELN